MSELKSFIVLYDGKFIRAYEESEADKVIAKLEEKLDTTEKLLNKALDCISNGKNHMMSLARKNNHANYKRFLAMAEMCRTNAVLADLLSPKRTSRKFICWKNRYEKFLKLADKFKEAK